MKFVEYNPFDSLNLFLDHVNLGKSTIKGSLEAYICKHSGTDRKMSFSLEHEILTSLGRSSDSGSGSPVSKLSSKSSRKTLIYLILTLSQMYPDYDFSAVKAHLCFNEEGWNGFQQIFEMYMADASQEWALTNETCLLDNIRLAIDEIVKLDECEIYSYNPDVDGDPFLEKGAIWSFNFFFYNRKLKRLVSFRCCCLSNLVTDDFVADWMHEENEHEEIFDGMDI